jgi:O-antigen ligase
LVTVGLILTYFQYATRKERIVLGSIAILALGLEGLADSRSSFVALAIGCALYACWRYRGKGLLAVAAVSVLAVLGLMFAGNNPYIWRGDVWTVTGRTEMWKFVLQQLADKPITGYGYQVGGAIFGSRYFPIWWGPYDEGPHSSIHNGYLQHMVEVGIPATIFWLFVVLRPWFALLAQTEDRWRLKRILFFVVIPLLLVNLDEEMLGDGAGPSGFLFAIVWAIAEQHRLSTIRHAATARHQALRDLPGAAGALRFSESIR